MNYQEQILADCQQLEHITSVGLEELADSHQLIGKQWYALGLEDDNSDAEKDLANKKGIVARVVERIVSFMKSIAEKIAKWYQRCKAMILRFFRKDEVNPKQVVERFASLSHGLNDVDVGIILNELNVKVKHSLAEVIDITYNRPFYLLYADYRRFSSKSSDIAQFQAHEKFFTDFKGNVGRLKAVALKNKIYENADDIIRQFLLKDTNLTIIERVCIDFKEIETVQEQTTAAFEKILKAVPDYDFSKSADKIAQVQQQIVLKEVSDLLKLSSELALQVNSHLFAVSELMSKITKRRFRKMSFIPH